MKAQVKSIFPHKKNALIIGIGVRTRRLAEQLLEQGYHVIGFADEVGLEQQLDHGFCPLGGIQGGERLSRVAGLGEDLAEYLRHQVVDEVFLGLASSTWSGVGERVCRLCAEHGITVRLLPDFVSPDLASASVERLARESFITLRHGAMTDERLMSLKRAIDFSAASLLLLALLPLLAVIAALIKLTSKGPVFFVQERIGLNKRHFGCFKFRTMVPDAEERIHELEDQNEVEGPVFKIAGDPRITPFGAFLRKTSIDELPQLLNVLRGDMSLVGPRPLPVRDYEGFELDSHRRRLSVRPGITCLWQVSGRSGIPFERWMELDLEYIDRWSLWLDLQILARTFPAVLRGTGAA